ncbi:MAG TPA: hypothetical protein VNA65_05785 [Candidatus Dormibacteraeota bacterium]|nr:hypothetical protein [Candidatus Dormibacteraeota bacterium]
MLQLGGEFGQLLAELRKIDSYLYTLFHLNVVFGKFLEDSLGLLLKVWFQFVVTTVDVESGGDFVTNATIQRFEPKVQLIADAALVLIAMWAAYRIMWGHGLFTQYTARIMLPRLAMAAVLINFALPMFQSAVSACNVISNVVMTANVHDDLATFGASFANDPNAGTWEMLTTAGLALGYGVLAITYFLRYAILIVLAITAPLAGLFFLLPETHHISKMWASQFTTNLVMQPAQLFVLSIGLALEHDGISPIHHLFALASLLIVLKVPGAMGGSEKAAHQLQSIIKTSLHHLAHALAKA